MRARDRGLAVAACWLLLACSSASPHASPAKGAITTRARSADAGLSVVCANDPARDDGGLVPDAAAAPREGLCTATCECEEAIPVTSAQHVSGAITYTDPPPVGGNHNACWTTWGVHAQAIGAEHWVHNLEHGGVVFLYHCAKPCATEVSQMADFVRAHRLALLTEYDAMPKRFAVVAWGYRLQTDTLDLSAFEAFYQAHVDHGPESIDSNPPSSCP